MTSTLPEPPLAPADVAAERQTAPDTAGRSANGPVSRSPALLAWNRFRQDRKTVFSAVVVLLYFVAAIVAPILVATGVLDPLSINQDLIGSDSLPIGPFGGISWAHPLGIEPGIGRDTLARVWYGLTFSLIIASVSAALSMIIGVVLGIVAGLSGGWVDTIIGRLIDLTLSFPQTLMLLALSGTVIAFLTGVLQVPAGDVARGLFVIIVLAAFGWVTVARVIRGQVLSIREREYIEASKLIGASPMRRYFREVLPNLWAPILVQATLMMPVYISTETALAYLGVSIQQPTPTLGNVLEDAVRYPVADPVYFFVPVVVLIVLVVAFNLLGDGLRDALDPKSNR